MKLTVIIVSYNVSDLLRDSLRSVFASAARSRDWLDVEVIVVDNASHDGSAQRVAAEFPTVHLIASPENLGFTGGNNLALDVAGFAEARMRGCDDATRRGGEEARRQERRGTKEAADELAASNDTPSAPRIHASTPPRIPNFILLLNPDTEVVDDALGQMVGFLRDHPHVGACGAHLRYGDGQFQHGAFRFPTLTQVALDLLPLASAPGVRRFLPRLLDSRLNGRYPQEQWMADMPFPVDFVLGAALMVRAEAIRQIGLLDEAYFMYCEEMDWCLRLQQAGWPVYALPTAHVIHHEGQSSKQVRWASFEHLWRSRFRFYSKHATHYPPGHGIWLRLLVRLGLAIRSRQACRRFARWQRSRAQPWPRNCLHTLEFWRTAKDHCEPSKSPCIRSYSLPPVL
jgi:N-acetylglucosaminyl-diphospho-decaprenol L-rhamnosyltransferase